MSEVENIAPGLRRDLHVELPAGTYETACKPGMSGKGIRGAFNVTGESKPLTDDAKLAAAAENYQRYVKSQTEALIVKTREFVDAVKAGDAALAKALYPVARTYWERIEQGIRSLVGLGLSEAYTPTLVPDDDHFPAVAEIFGDLDPLIDGREADLEPGTEFTGFHKIEKDLWVANDVSQSGPVADKLLADVQKIVETQVEMMGGEIPYRDYTFILHLRANAGGGLEHSNSTALGYPRFGFKIQSGDRATSASPTATGTPERDYRGFLSLVSHEFYHLWNVKRIRPDALGPFDYTQENYTKVLWVAEGVTDYYADLLLRRAGLITESEFLTATARALQTLQNTPGRMEQSLEESSFDTWIKFYRPDENTINSQVSYYDKGAIVGLLLDLEIRKRSKNAKSLDDVLRYLYTEFFKKDRNYGPADFQKASELMAGSSLEDFFGKYVRGTEELDYNAALEAAGLRLDTGVGSVERVYFGADVAQEDDRLIVRRVHAGSPAYDQGLNADDQIVALDNARVTRDFFNARIAEKKPGDLITLTIFRFDELSMLQIKLGGRREGTYRILPLTTQTESQKRIYRSWLG